MEDDKKTETPEEGAIQQTNDYGIFKYIESNRTISKSHVQHLVQSFESNPALIKTRPILVNEKMEIIDGQHRLQACMALRIPVYYTVAKGTDVEAAQLMNALQKGWTTLDYARSYAMSGKSEYKEFLRLQEEFPIAATILMVFCVGRNENRINTKFKRGEFHMMEDRKLIEKQLGMLEDFSEMLPFWRDYNFGKAVHDIFLTPGYDHERMLKKLKGMPIKRQVSRVDYIRELEAQYNKHMEADKIARFY